MATPGRIISRFDGKLYKLASGRLARWTDNPQFELQFSTPGSFLVEYRSTNSNDEDFDLTRTSGIVAFIDYATNAIYSQGTGGEFVLITNATRFQLVWSFSGSSVEGWSWFYDTAAIMYWSEEGVFGPYYPSGHFSGTYQLTETRTKTYVNVPERIDVIPILDAP